MTTLDPKSAMVVFSGGQDSTTCLAWALANFETVRCVSFDYGQKHDIELDAARSVLDFLREATGRDIQHEIVMLGNGTFAGTSPLTNKDEALETYENHDEMEAIIGNRVEKTFVPMRNAVFLMLAANRAVVAGCANLVTGVCQADNANYPDCREDFVDSAEETINEALGLDQLWLNGKPGALYIHTPLMDLSKAESIELAMEIPHGYTALAYSHTAYNGEYPPTGKDHASVLRAHGFEEAGMPDPLVVRAWAEELMELPLTNNYSMFNQGVESEAAEHLPRIQELLAHLVEKHGFAKLAE
jgi:7-cyano-7-deazaguanine synthase